MWDVAVERSASSAASSVFKAVIRSVMAAFSLAASVWLPSKRLSFSFVWASSRLYT